MNSILHCADVEIPLKQLVHIVEDTHMNSVELLEHADPSNGSSMVRDTGSPPVINDTVLGNDSGRKHLALQI